MACNFTSPRVADAGPKRWRFLICASCGKTLQEGSRFCKFCVAAVVALPVPAPGLAPAPQQTSGKAIASLVLGFFFYLLPAAIAGVILGHLSLSQIRNSAGRLKGAPENDGGPNVKYQVVAYPLNHNQSGVRAFCSDESGVIKSEQSGSPQACLENGVILQ